MKIVVIGGSGLIGSKLVKRLRDQRHEVLAASPQSGVDTITGKGLDEALTRADVVVDVANSPSLDGKAALEFFQSSCRNLLAADKRAGVGHHVTLSIVGTDRLPDNAYFQAKVAQEKLVKASGVPFSIVRSTQFFEFVGRIAEDGREGENVRMSSGLVQPIAADDVAAALADVALGAPLNGTIEIAGPERFGMDEWVRRFFAATSDSRGVIGDPHARYFGSELEEGSITAGSDARIGRTRFSDWLDRTKPTVPVPKPAAMAEQRR
jgi:uncharacterized protein YbjT (DUF2867 family)